MWWLIGLFIFVVAVIAIVINRRGSTSAYDTSADYRPDTSAGGPPPTGGGFEP